MFDRNTLMASERGSLVLEKGRSASIISCILRLRARRSSSDRLTVTSRPTSESLLSTISQKNPLGSEWSMTSTLSGNISLTAFWSTKLSERRKVLRPSG